VYLRSTWTRRREANLSLTKAKGERWTVCRSCRDDASSGIRLLRRQEGRMQQLWLKGLRVRGRVGCKDSERAHPQMLHVDLCIVYDMREAVMKDDVAHAIDYKGVAACVRELTAAKQWHLIETLASDVANVVRAISTRIKRVEATVAKDVITDVGAVAVVFSSEA
jgi:FolB domain-containing protein